MAKRRIIGAPGSPRSENTVSTHPTRDEAIASAMAASADGDELAIHASTCAMKDGRLCDCVVEVIVVRRGEA